VYIRQRNLPALKQYKYAGVDKSLVSKYILKPFYTHVVIKCFPMSMASVNHSFFVPVCFGAGDVLIVGLDAF
jgi:hypothetical protein